MAIVIAHRGANRLAPENTLAAFAAARRLGAHGFETDVHLTQDGHLVLCHDETVDRCSNGKGRIAEMPLVALRALDFGSWFHPDFAGERIPTAQEFFALCQGLRVINVELKAPGTGPVVLRMAEAAGVLQSLLLSSFSLECLQEAHDANPNARLALLFGGVELHAEALYADPVAFAAEHDLCAYHPFVGLVSQTFVATCQAANLDVNPWTVNQAEAMQTLTDWGCAGLITDETEVALQALAVPKP